MFVAVIIPVFNSASQLRATLLALLSGTRKPDVLVVVDDASRDDSASVAEELGARVIRVPINCGPAACRNLAAQTVSSDVLVFLDADTCVHADTLAAIEGHFLRDSGLSAVIGAYDDAARAPGWCSQYRNLAHCYVHRSSHSDALTFWSGCGGIRRDVFFEVKGFDERYRHPSVEDIDLGYRMTDRGHRILLDSSIIVTHTKRWSLANSVRTDLLARGVPWTVLLLDRWSMPDDLNLAKRFRLSAACTAIFLLCVLLSFRQPMYWAGAALAAAVAVLAHHGLFRFIVQRKGTRFLPIAMLFFFQQQFCSLVALPIGIVVWMFRDRDRSQFVTSRLSKQDACAD